MPFVKPEKKQEGTKFLFYGTAGSGKTPTGLSFPGIALVDSDSGSNFYDLSNVKLATSSLSYKDLADDLDELEMDEDLFESIKTFTVDSLTRFHETMSIAMNKIAENRAANNGREAESEGLSFREYGKMKTYYEEFYSRMVTYAKQGKNLVFIAEQKDKTENKNGEMKKIGVVPNAQKDIEYDFDVVVRTYQEEVKEGGKKAYYPKGVVLKDRTGTFNVGDIVDKPTYDLWKSAVENNQQGQKRNKSEIKSVKQASEEEISVLDDGESLRNEVLGIIKDLDESQKEEGKKALEEAIGTYAVHKITDVDKLKKALKVVKNIK